MDLYYLKNLCMVSNPASTICQQKKTMHYHNGHINRVNNYQVKAAEAAGWNNPKSITISLVQFFVTVT